MIIFGANGNALAEVRFGGEDHCIDSRTGPAARKLFEILKSIPRRYLHVDIRYFRIGYDKFVPLTKEIGNNMDIQSALDYSEEQNKASNQDKEPKIVFVAPRTENVPDDGVLFYSTVESIYDFGKVDERSVVLVSSDQLPLLKCVCDNTSLFGLELRVITGLPQSDYTSGFEEATWNLERVAYVPFISELKLASEVETQLNAEKSTAYDRERSVYTRKDGSVKGHSKFDVITPTSEDSDDAAVE